MELYRERKRDRTFTIFIGLIFSVPGTLAYLLIGIVINPLLVFELKKKVCLLSYNCVLEAKNNNKKKYVNNVLRPKRL